MSRLLLSNNWDLESHKLDASTGQIRFYFSVLIRALPDLLQSAAIEINDLLIRAVFQGLRLHYFSTSHSSISNSETTVSPIVISAASSMVNVLPKLAYLLEPDQIDAVADCGPGIAVQIPPHDFGQFLPTFRV